MITKSRLPFIAATALALSLQGNMLAAQPLLERPRLENYKDYNQFLNDMAAYKRQQRELEQRPANSRQAAKTDVSTVPAPTQLAAVSAPPSSQEAPPPSAVQNLLDPPEDAPPPIAISGPEDLETAVQQAKAFPHPSYSTPRRYNRSTAQSFPLTPLGSGDMQGSAVDGTMQQAPRPTPEALQQQTDERNNAIAQVQTLDGAKKSDDDEKRKKEVDEMIQANTYKEVIFIPSAEVTYFPGASGRSGGVDDIYIYHRNQVSVREH